METFSGLTAGSGIRIQGFGFGVLRVTEPLYPPCTKDQTLCGNMTWTPRKRNL